MALALWEHCAAYVNVVSVISEARAVSLPCRRSCDQAVRTPPPVSQAAAQVWGRGSQDRPWNVGCLIRSVTSAAAFPGPGIQAVLGA